VLCEGARHRRVRISLPPHDPFRGVHEEGREATDSVPNDLPHAAEGLRVHEANGHPVSVPRARGANPFGHAQELGLGFRWILVELLPVNLLPDPRSFQERLAVGSVVEAGEHRRHDFDQHRTHLHPPGG